MVYYYTYCPACGHQTIHSYPTGIGALHIEKVVSTSLNIGAINYFTCPKCKLPICGMTLMKENTLQEQVELRSLITLNMNEEGITPEKFYRN